MVQTAVVHSANIKPKDDAGSEWHRETRDGERRQKPCSLREPHNFAWLRLGCFSPSFFFFRAGKGFPGRARRPCYSLYSLHGWSHIHLLTQRDVLGLCCGSFQPENEQESQDRRPWPAGSKTEMRGKRKSGSRAASGRILFSSVC